MLQITEHTVKAHVKPILAKLGAMGRTEANCYRYEVRIDPGRLKRRCRYLQPLRQVTAVDGG
jgi:Bacterial regulatory proteins, luxR family